MSSRKKYEAIYCLFEQDAFVEIVKSTVSSDNGAKRPLFSGPYAEGYNLMIQAGFGRERYNYSSVIESTYGILNGTTGMFDGGCMAALQEHRADAAVLYAPFPVLVPGLRQNQVYDEDRLVILSSYTIKDTDRLNDVVENFFYAFDPPLWLVIFGLEFVFYFLFKVLLNLEHWKTKIDRLIGKNWHPPAPKNALYQVLTHLLQVETMEYQTNCLQFASFLATLVSFLILLYLSNLLNASIVIEDPPEVIQSYDDILKVPIIRPLFIRLQNDYKEFEFAPPNSKERKIWQKALKHYSRDDLFIKSNAAPVLFSFLMNVHKEMNEKRKTLGIMSKFLAPIAQCTICAVKARALVNKEVSEEFKRAGMKAQLHSYAYLSSDPSVKGRLVGPVFSANFTSPLSRRIDKRCENIFEFGIFSKVKADLRRPFSDITRFNEYQHKQYKDCIQDDYHQNMHLHENDFSPMHIGQFVGAAILYSSIVAAALLVLLLESRKRRSNRVRPSKDHKQEQEVNCKKKQGKKPPAKKPAAVAAAIKCRRRSL